MAVKVREKVKGSGEWYIFIDHQGKRKAKKVGRDKRVAIKAAKTIEANLVLNDVGILNQDSSPSFASYVMTWKTTAKYLSLKHSTRRGYNVIIRKYLIPSFGKTKLTEINKMTVSGFIDKLFVKGLRSQTVRNIKNCLSSIMDSATKQHELIPRNPCIGIVIPTPMDETPLREPRPMGWSERESLEETFKVNFDFKYYVLVVTGHRTGLRIGELIGLRWCDIDWHNRIIEVKRNVTEKEETTPKSKSSLRQVRMTSFLLDLLKRYKTHAKELSLKYGIGNLPEWVFFNEDGNFINYDNFLKRQWHKAIEKSELMHRTPHDMRHTYATLRLSKGDSLAEVSKEMGHSNQEITYRTYYKWLPMESTSNIDELDGLQPSATYTQP